MQQQMVMMMERNLCDTSTGTSLVHPDYADTDEYALS